MTTSSTNREQEIREGNGGEARIRGGDGGRRGRGKTRSKARYRFFSSPRTKFFATPHFFFFSPFFPKHRIFSLPSMENAPPVVPASALPQSHAWETVKENFKPLKKGRRPEELAPEVAPLGLACAAPPGAEEERRCVGCSSGVVKREREVLYA